MSEALDLTPAAVLLPAEAYPFGVYSGNRRMTPDQVHVEASEVSLCLWLDGLMIGVSRTADDTMLQGALSISAHITQSAERFGSLVRAELERRARAREAEPSEAAMRAAERARPYVAPPVAAPGEADPTGGAPVWFTQPAPAGPQEWPLISDTTPAEVPYDA